MVNIKIGKNYDRKNTNMNGLTLQVRDCQMWYKTSQHSQTFLKHKTIQRMKVKGKKQVYTNQNKAGVLAILLSEKEDYKTKSIIKNERVSLNDNWFRSRRRYNYYKYSSI